MVRQPVVVLDVSLHVGSVNDAFCKKFGVSSGDVQGRSIFEIGRGEWNAAALRTGLEAAGKADGAAESFELLHEFASLGAKSVRLNVRRMRATDDLGDVIVLALEDVNGDVGK